MVPGIILYVMIIISKKIIMVAGIVLYAPALALSAVTGLHFEGAVIGIGDLKYDTRNYTTTITATTTTKTTTTAVIGIDDLRYDDNNNKNNSVTTDRIQCQQ